MKTGQTSTRMAIIISTNKTCPRIMSKATAPANSRNRMPKTRMSLVLNAACRSLTRLTPGRLTE